MFWVAFFYLCQQNSSCFMKLLFPFAIIALVISCQSSTHSNQTKAIANSPKAVKSLVIENISPLRLNIGTSIKMVIKDYSQYAFDSIELKIDFKRMKPARFDQGIIEIDTKPLKTGKRKINIVGFTEGNEIARGEVNITLLSDITPENYTYQVVKTYQHNTQWYTQGLEFSNGILYEGTGMNGESGLYKVNIKTNEILQSVNLPDDVFGEGITILNDKIYQLTWRSQVGFVYEKETLKKLYDFNYPTEGWGLTNNGKELIMSDGSENIYFMDTEFLQETNRIEVYDYQGPVQNLNELELVGNKLYANIYTTDTIVVIDIETGKVLQKINMSGLLDKTKLTQKTDVLNGIAFDKTTNQWYVTGKWWPTIFQVKWIKK